MAVDELKNGKSSGVDNPITAEVLKYGGHHAIRQLCNICNDVYMQEKAPLASSFHYPRKAISL